QSDRAPWRPRKNAAPMAASNTATSPTFFNTAALGYSGFSFTIRFFTCVNIFGSRPVTGELPLIAQQRAGVYRPVSEGTRPACPEPGLSISFISFITHPNHQMKWAWHDEKLRTMLLDNGLRQTWFFEFHFELVSFAK